MDLQSSILFNSSDGEGFSLRDALSHRYGALEAREELMFVQLDGPTVSLRLNVSHLHHDTICEELIVSGMCSVAWLPAMDASDTYA